MRNYQHLTFGKVFRTLKQRLHLLWSNPYLTLAERWEIVRHVHIYRARVVDKFLRKRLMTDSDGERYFDLPPYKIYFEPEFPIHDLNFFLLGMTQVLTETFVLPRFFSRHVFIHEGDTVLDVGANIGTTTLFFSEYVGRRGQIVAIEPVTHHVIRKNLVANQVGNVIVVPCAVAEHPGFADICISDYCLNSSIVPQAPVNYHTFSQTVEVTTLDRLMETLPLRRVDFIKIDIEGAEESAILGASELIRAFRPKWSISSYHLDALREPQHPKLVRLLKKMGYAIKEEEGSHIFAW